MGLDRALGPAYRTCDLLIGLAANDEFEDFPLTRRQSGDLSANHVQRDLPVTRYFMTSYRPFDCAKKLVRRYGLGQKIFCTRLDSLHRDGDIGMTCQKHDGQG